MKVPFAVYERLTRPRAISEGCRRAAQERREEERRNQATLDYFLSPEPRE